MVQALTKHVISIILWLGLLILSILTFLDLIEFPDWSSYELIYLGLSSNDLGFDVLYKVSMSVCKEFHFSYFQFRIVLFSAIFAAFSQAIKRLDWTSQIGLIVINFIFLTCQIRQGIFVSILYLIYANSYIKSNKTRYIIASLFHSKTGLLYLVFLVYERTPLLLRIVGLMWLFYLLTNFIDYYHLIPTLKDYIFHFELDETQFSLVSLVVPGLYLFLFRKCPSFDRLILILPLIVILYSIYIENILGGKIIVNSFLRLMPVFLSVMVITRRKSFGKLDLLIVLIIFLKDIYSSQV